MTNTVKTKLLNIDTGREPVVYLNACSDVVKTEGFYPMTRVKIFNNKKIVYATLNLVDDIVSNDEIGLSKVVSAMLEARNNDKFEVKHMEPLLSFAAVREKLRGKPFTEDGIFNVIKDVVDGKYTDMHMAALCSATEAELSSDEIAYLAKAMINTGKVVKWDYDIVVDKHCIGGLPGNRTTPPAIAIIAEYGLHIPKISSRAITSCAGTADVMEVLTNIVIQSDKMKEVVDTVGGCLAWGGGNSEINPSDDIIINVKTDLNLDSRSQMLASIISKKIAAGSTHILIDVPYGPTAKSKTKEAAESLKKDFETLGAKLGAKVVVNISDGSQPVGNGVGPALEARDVIKVLKNEADAPQDLKEKTIYLSGLVIEFDPKVKKGDGAKIAREILESGRAWERFKKICEAQGGGMKEIPVAKFAYDVVAKNSGKVCEFDNKKLAYLAKLAGCPSQWAAGVYLYKHLGDNVKEGEKIYTIYSNSKGELELAIQLTKEVEIVKIK